MVGANELATETDQDAVSNVNKISIEEDAIVIYHRHSVKSNILSEAATKAILDKDVFVIASHKLLDDFRSLGIGRLETMKLVEHILYLALEKVDLFVPAVEWLSRKSLFKLGHIHSSTI